MGEIRIVGPGKTHGYPYPVCKKFQVGSFQFVCVDLGNFTFRLVSYVSFFSNFE